MENTNQPVKIETIKPNPLCRLCGGSGEVATGTVPYGSTYVSLPPDYCDCVLEQVKDDESDIELDLSEYNQPDDGPIWETGEE